MNIKEQLVTFSNNNMDFYNAALSYFCDKKQSVENKTLMQKAYLAEVERMAGVGKDTYGWAAHPSVKWASMAIVDNTINAILPEVILPQFGIFADFRTQGYGDVTKFTVQPNTMYTISLSGRGERQTLRQRKFKKDILVTPIEHIVTVYENMYNVLSDRANIADFLSWILVSVQSSMYGDALNALTTGLSNIPAGTQNVTGAFDMKNLVKMCETVQSKNGGVKPVICGSASALLNVIPDPSNGWRINTESTNMAIELVRNVVGYDVLKLDNAVNAAGSLVLPDNKLFVVSPSQDKLIKGVMENTLTNSNDFYDNADITQNYTYRKAWDFVYASAAQAGIYTIS